MRRYLLAALIWPMLIYSNAHAEEMGYVCHYDGSVSWGKSPCPNIRGVRQERVPISSMEAYAKGVASDGGLGGRETRERQASQEMACLCRQKYEESERPMSIEAKIAIDNWTFKNCFQQKISRFDCKR